MKKRNLMIALLLAVLLTFSACTQGTGSTASSAGADGSAAVTVNEADYFSDRDRSGAWDESKAVSITLNGNSAACDGSGVEIDGSVGRPKDAPYAGSGLGEFAGLFYP